LTATPRGAHLWRPFAARRSPVVDTRSIAVLALIIAVVVLLIIVL
jgi:hypothetical protein